MLARDEGEKCVACVALYQSTSVDLEEPDGVKVTLLVARNDVFEGVDYNFCNEIERLLAALGASARKHTKLRSCGRKSTWASMLHYNEPHLEQYTLDLQRSVLAFADSGYLDRIPPYHLARPVSNHLVVETFCDSNAIGSYCRRPRTLTYSLLKPTYKVFVTSSPSVTL
ncbi:hypothetical protein F5141DRAFT_69396 [Pisolithus sp. B1]|nr:hypothetical protein F5141DRAFT_69396 [Pisolithus sp. B1]